MDLRNQEEVIEEAIKASKEGKEEAFFNELRNNLRTSEDPVYSKQQWKKYLKEVREAITGKDSGSLKSMLESLSNAVSYRGRPLTESDLLNSQIIRDVKITDEARSEDFNWGSISIWVAPLEAEGKTEQAEALKSILENAKLQQQTRRRKYKIGRQFKPFIDIDIRQYKARNAMYNYWEGIANHYDEKMHLPFIQSLKKDLMGGEVSEKQKVNKEKFLKDIESLEKIFAPNYILKTKGMKISTRKSMEKKWDVLEAFLERIGAIAEFRPTVTFGAGAKVDEEGGGPVEFEGEMEVEEAKDIKEQEKVIQQEADEAERRVEDLSTSTIDPILYWAWEQGMVRVPFTKEEFKMDELERGGKDLLLEIDEGLWRDFQKFLVELEQSADASERAEYYIPLSEVPEGVEWKKVPGQPDEMLGERNSQKFFELLGGLIEEFPNRFALKQEPVDVGLGDTQSSQSSAYSSMRSHMRNMTSVQFPAKESDPFPMSKKTAEEFQTLLEKLTTYYLIPLKSEGKFYQEKPRFAELAQFESLIKSAKNHPLQKLNRAIQSANLANTSPEEMDAIADFLEDIRNPLAGVDKKLLRSAKTTLRALDSFLGKSHDNKTMIGSNLALIAEFQGQNPAEINFEGYSLAELKEDNESKPSQTLPMLESVLNSTKVKAHLNLMDGSKPIHTAKQISRLRGTESPETKLFDAIKRVATLLNDLQKEDPLAAKLLQAHDIIRKLKGKVLSYGRLDIDDPDDVSLIMKRVLVTAPEIRTIVKSYDSHVNLSKNHGISEDDIYMIKGMFR